MFLIGEECSISNDHKMFVCETHAYREMSDLPTCVSCPSASDEAWMYTVLNWTYVILG